MQAFTTHSGPAAPMLTGSTLMSNIDTDMVIPKQFLKALTRKDICKDALFHELRTTPDGTPDPDFILNRPEFRSASILIAGDNFGCGSSREHAVWALLDQGIACVIAPSFADIFYNNCLKNGLLPIALPEETCADMAGMTGGNNHVFTIDLPNQSLTAPDGSTRHFDIDPGVKAKLLAGQDEIAQSMEYADHISRFETRRRQTAPWLERLP